MVMPALILDLVRAASLLVDQTLVVTFICTPQAVLDKGPVGRGHFWRRARRLFKPPFSGRACKIGLRRKAPNANVPCGAPAPNTTVWQNVTDRVFSLVRSS
jgi:hypothetical protein